MRHKMLLRKTLEVFLFFFNSSNIFQRNILALKVLSKWNSKSHRSFNQCWGIDATIAFDMMELKPLVCASQTAHEGSSAPPASCSTLGARHRQVGFVISFWLRAFLSFEWSTRKLLLNPQGLSSSLLPLHCTMFSHSAHVISASLWCTKENLNKRTPSYTYTLYFV